MFPSKKLLIGVTGSIAAFKVAHVISHFKKMGWDVRTIATPSALQFIGQATLEGLSENEVLTSDFTPGKMMSHIDVARWADVFLIAPATAKAINNLAAGTGDGVLYSTYLAYETNKPLLIAPAMNTQMLVHPTTQASLKTLETNGATLLKTESGLLACGETGEGRLLEPEHIVAAVERALAPKNQTTKILITMGGTRVPIDSVRSITNTSSGATGAQLADDLFRQGYNVTVIAGMHAQRPTLIQNVLNFDTYHDLEAVLQSHLKTHSYTHIIHMAAVSDFVVPTTKGKLSSGTTVALDLVPTKKLISMIKSLAPQSFLTGFKLTVNETPADVEKSVKTVFRNSADAVVHNDTSQISKSHHTFTLYLPQGPVATVNQKSELVSLFTNSLIKNTQSLNASEVRYDSLS